jgi:GTPase
MRWFSVMKKVRASIPEETMRKLNSQHQLQIPSPKNDIEKPTSYLFHSSNCPFRYLKIAKTLPSASIRQDHDKKPSISPEDSKILRVAVLGPPNAGKSTVINRMVGKKVAISSAISHTTRSVTSYWFQKGNTQVTLSDGPGIIPFNQFKNSAYRDIAIKPWLSLHNTDLALVLLDVNSFRRSGQGKFVASEEIMWLLQKLKTFNIPAVLALNKVDLLKDHDQDFCNEIIKFCMSKYSFIYNIVMSAKDSTSSHELRDLLLSEAKPGEWMFDGDRRTTASDLTCASEFIKEKFLRFSGKTKVPMWLGHKLEFVNQGWTQMSANEVRIDFGVKFQSKKDLWNFVEYERGKLAKMIVNQAAADVSSLIRKKAYLFLDLRFDE